MKPLIIKQTTVRILGLFLCVIFSVLSVFAFYTHATYPGILFVAMFLFGAYTVLAEGTIYLDNLGITNGTRFLTYHIDWDEITHIEVDHRYSYLVFGGDSKRLVTLGPIYWNGKDKLEGLVFMATQIKQRSIALHDTPKALLRWNKNTRIKT